MKVTYRRVHGRCRSSNDARPIALLLLIVFAAAEALAQTPANAAAQPAESGSTLTADATAAGNTMAGSGGDVVLYGTGSYGTLVNLFFMLSALFTDILIIRVWLVLAYIFLAVNVLMNFPDVTEWSTNSSPRKLILGTLVWTVVTLALQLWALVILVLDELPVRLSGDDELLWRMFFRRCGMTRKEFQHVLKLGTWQHFKAGETVEQRNKDEPRLYVVFKGCLELVSRDSCKPRIPCASGTMVNMYLFNLFGICMGFENDVEENALLLAATDVVLFSWDVTALLKISSGEVSIALPAYFRSMALYLVSFEYCRLHLGEQPCSSSGQPEPDAAAWLRGEAMTRDFTEPLGPNEQNKTKFWGAIWSMLCSFNLTIPRGLRHMPNPKTGSMARSRVLLAAHMRKNQQHVPAALAHDKAVLAAQGLRRHRINSVPTKLQKQLTRMVLRLASSTPEASRAESDAAEAMC